ncbi:MAG: hypothetical protein Q7K65_04805 [Candidatus Buchananbacteria bacterium]|nr:hypothetical protein [Candidatus Buchananbacteria bacterium]
MKENKGPQKLSDLFVKIEHKKMPAYQWQDLALRLISDLGVPNFKRNSIFKICKDNGKEKIERALNDTKELCQTGEKWKYFFKIIAETDSQKNDK